MLKNLVKSGFRALGLEVRRVDRSSRRPVPGSPERVDPAEIRELEAELAAFSREEPRVEPWSDPGGAREYLSDRRLRFYRDLLEVVRDQGVTLDGLRVADVGSGTGYLLRRIHARHPAAQLTGFDTYSDITRLARHLCPTATFHERDLHDIDDPFDVVFCTEVLEHLYEPGEALRHLLGLLNPEGTLILTVPDGRADSFPAGGALDNGRGRWGHVNFWSPESWPLFLERSAPGWGRAWGLLETGENWAVLGRGTDTSPTGPRASP